MVNRLLRTISVLTLMAAGNAAAVELGSLTLVSGGATGTDGSDSTGDAAPLEIRIDIHDIGNLTASQLQIAVAGVQTYQTLALERNATLDSLTARITSSNNPEVPLQLILQSSMPVDAPFIPLVLDTQWPGGRLLTEYTVRLQTPEFSAAQGVTVTEPVNQVELDIPVPADVADLPSVAADDGDMASSAPASESTGASSAVATQSGAGSASLTGLPETLTVQSGDTLWELALQVRPDSSVSVQQTMLALQQLNPDAFINNNINRVQRGAVLRVPVLDDIRQIGQQSAIDEVRRQNTALGAAASSASRAASLAAGSATGNAQGELRVVSVDEQNDQEVDPQAAGSQDAERNRRLNELEDRLAVRQEEVDRLESENSELEARLSMLQQQIASAQEIIRLRDLELAQLQETLVEQREQAANETATADEMAETEPGQEEADPGQTVVTMAPDPGPVQRLLNMMQQNPLLFMGGIVLAIALLVLLLAARNRAERKRDQEASAESDKTLLSDQDSDLVFPEASETGKAPSEDNEADAADEDSDGEPIVADREESDFEALLNAEASSDDAGDEVDSEVDDASREDDLPDPENDWADPLADLEAGDEEEAESGDDQSAPKSMYDDSVVLDDNTDLDQLLDQEVEDQEETSDQNEDVDSTETPAEWLEEEDVLDPETDLSWPDEAGLAESVTPEVEEPEETADADMDMSDEFDISIADEEPDVDGEDNLDTELDIDPDIDDTQASADSQPEQTSDAEEAADPTEELSAGEEPFAGEDFLVGEEPSADQEPSADKTPSADEAPSADQTSLADEESASVETSVIVEETEAEAPEAEAPAADSSTDDNYLDELAFISTPESLEDDEEDPDFPFLTDSDESASKLDLARAYIDMGDTEGAKEILAEVIEEGRDEQREDARKLLERL